MQNERHCLQEMRDAVQRGQEARVALATALSAEIDRINLEIEALQKQVAALRKERDAVGETRLPVKRRKRGAVLESVLHALRDGFVTVDSIANKINITKQHTTNVLLRLVELKVVERRGPGIYAIRATECAPPSTDDCAVVG